MGFRAMVDDGAGNSSAKQRLLLVEDNAENQKVAMLMLQKLGYKADAVSNGSEALDALEQQSYDLILMNIRMPLMDGIKTTREIRRRGGCQKIIALTASVFPGSEQMCLDAGMDGYIAKPVDIKRLGKLLSE